MENFIIKTNKNINLYILYNIYIMTDNLNIARFKQLLNVSNPIIVKKN